MLMSNKILDQAEIDALLNSNFVDEHVDEHVHEKLSDEDLDALGEIANISMGSAATVLSELVNQQVVITNPTITKMTYRELVAQLPDPYMAIEVQFTKGLKGANLLVLKNADCEILANMMMGEPPVAKNEIMDEMHMSAATEAMNQMIASSATAMSQVFNTSVDISPPDLILIDNDSSNIDIKDMDLVVIKFNMTVGDIINSELIQMMPVLTAKEQARLLFNVTNVTENQEVLNDTPTNHGSTNINSSNVNANPVSTMIATTYPEEDNYMEQEFSGGEKNFDLILDIPLKVSVELGRTKKPINEILQYQSGSILELNKLVDENVDILVNGTLVAKGEVVVINENFGVKITNIISPKERIMQLRNKV